jgi:anti-sigma regulatory factor (Ser/Thr protein kinase)
LAGSDVLSLTLPPTARAAADGRRFVVQALTDWQCDALIDAAALLVSELVTNAVVHARTALSVSIRRVDTGLIRIEVSDGSSVFPRRRRAAADATTGRGVALLESLASDWSVRLTGTGKSVEFVLDPRHDPWAAAEADWLAGEL